MRAIMACFRRTDDISITKMKRSFFRLTLCLLITIVFVGVIRAQDAKPTNTVLVNSWKKGTERVHEQAVRVVLDSKQRDFVTEISSSSGKRYKLSLVNKVSKRIPLEYWAIQLREVMSCEGNESLGDNLILGGQPEPGTDYFPREDLIGYLYPKEVTSAVIDGLLFYPMSTVRKIRIEGFCMIARVFSYRINDADKNRVEYVDLVIEFRNANGTNSC